MNKNRKRRLFSSRPFRSTPPGCYEIDVVPVKDGPRRLIVLTESYSRKAVLLPAADPAPQ